MTAPATTPHMRTTRECWEGGKQKNCGGGGGGCVTTLSTSFVPRSRQSLDYRSRALEVVGRLCWPLGARVVGDRFVTGPPRVRDYWGCRRRNHSPMEDSLKSANWRSGQNPGQSRHIQRFAHADEFDVITRPRTFTALTAPDIQLWRITIRGI